jgi:hypothetical protein
MSEAPELLRLILRAVDAWHDNPRDGRDVEAAIADAVIAAGYVRATPPVESADAQSKEAPDA